MLQQRLRTAFISFSVPVQLATAMILGEGAVLDLDLVVGAGEGRPSHHLTTTHQPRGASTLTPTHRG